MEAGAGSIVSAQNQNYIDAILKKMNLATSSPNRFHITFKRSIGENGIDEEEFYLNFVPLILSGQNQTESSEGADPIRVELESRIFKSTVTLFLNLVNGIFSFLQETRRKTLKARDDCEILNNNVVNMLQEMDKYIDSIGWLLCLSTKLMETISKKVKNAQTLEKGKKEKFHAILSSAEEWHNEAKSIEGKRWKVSPLVFREVSDRETNEEIMGDLKSLFKIHEFREKFSNKFTGFFSTEDSTLMLETGHIQSYIQDVFRCVDILICQLHDETMLYKKYKERIGQKKQLEKDLLTTMKPVKECVTKARIIYKHLNKYHAAAVVIAGPGQDDE